MEDLLSASNTLPENERRKRSLLRHRFRFFAMEDDDDALRRQTDAPNPRQTRREIRNKQKAHAAHLPRQSLKNEEGSGTAITAISASIYTWAEGTLAVALCSSIADHAQRETRIKNQSIRYLENSQHLLYCYYYYSVGCLLLYALGT